MHIKFLTRMLRKNAGCVNDGTLYCIQDVGQVALDLAFITTLLVFYIMVKDVGPRL